MSRTKIEVLLEDTRIRKYLCRWAPLTEHSYLWGLHRTLLVAFFADALFNGDFQEEYPLAARFSEKHFLYAERIVGNTILILLRVYGQCPSCMGFEFDILPYVESDLIELVLCRSCGAWLPNDGFYQWNSLGGRAGG